MGSNEATTYLSYSEKLKYLQNPSNFPFCADVEKYEKIYKIGQGTFGEVFKVKERRTDGQNAGKYFAMKNVLMYNEREGFPITALREISTLKKLNHGNVVKLIEICRSKPTFANNKYQSKISLIFEYCEHDLAGLLKDTNFILTLDQIKNLLEQLLTGVFYIHSKKVIHRDMKSANILVTKTGILKVADLGLARNLWDEDKHGTFCDKSGAKYKGYTNGVVTLWYRPPELLLGDCNYGPPIDMWGVGCIMAEMWTRRPIMQGNNEQEQLNLITNLCGSISPDVWPGVEKLDKYKNLVLPPGKERRVKERLIHFAKDAQACDLLDGLLTLDPSQRMDARAALEHMFFLEEPYPCDPSGLSKMMSQVRQSMYEYSIPRRR